MKKIISTLFSLVFAIGIFAQQAPPQGINYQAVIYSSTGNQQVGVNSAGQQLLNTHPVKVTFAITAGNQGPEVYKEEHDGINTDQYGMLTAIIGQGTQLSPSAFNQIDWSTGDMFLKVNIYVYPDPPVQSFTVSSYQKLWSVPYALYADQANYATNSGHADSSDYAAQAGNGITGVTDNGDGTLTFNYLDGSSYTTGSLTGLGSVGPQGPAGQNGTNGQSAYDIWLTQGNTGTQQDFLNSLLGAQGAAGSQGPIGLTGLAGVNGKNTLAKTTTETAGANCSTGGVKIEYGLDANNNGTLDVSEVNASLTKYVCNGLVGATGTTGTQGPQGIQGVAGPTGVTGAQGIQGTTGATGAAGINGANGTNGVDGKNTLAKTTTETVGANCATGGVKIEYGLDNNSNNILDAGEINTTLTKFICNGSVGATGSQGQIGLTGLTGSTGPQGIQGIQGPIGNPGSQNAWSLTGNAGTNPTTNFIGTTDSQDWAIKTNNIERMRITSAGNVGIGVNNPSHTLQAENNLGRFLLSSTTGATFVERTTGTPLKVIMGSNDNSQNLGVIELSRGNGSGESAFITTTGDGLNGVSAIGFSFQTPGIMFRVLNNGKVAIGTNTPDALLSVNGTASKAGGGSWATFSDKRVKHDINQFNDGLDVLMKLNPVTFKYNEKSGYTDVNKSFVGFIAQDVETVAPYMVNLYDDSDGPSGLSDKRQFDESALNKILVNAVQEQQAQIELLKKELEEMKTAIKELKKN